MRRGLTLPRRFRSTPKQAPFSEKEKNSELGIKAIVLKVIKLPSNDLLVPHFDLLLGSYYKTSPYKCYRSGFLEFQNFKRP